MREYCKLIYKHTTMGLFKCKSEKEKNIKDLYDESLRLSKQINDVKEKIEKEYPLVDSLSKIKEELEELKKKTTELEEYKSYAERISKENAELKQNGEKVGQIKWPFIFSIVIGLLFLVFSGFCVRYLLFSSTCVKVNDSIPMLIVGATIYFIMAVILIIFAYQSRQILSRKGNNNNKSKI